MKFFAICALLLKTMPVQAATPFIWSGAKIAAIFSSPSLNEKLGGGVESITLLKAASGTSEYLVKTLEPVATKRADGTRGMENSPCTVKVEVRSRGDMDGPEFYVSNAEAVNCPRSAL